MQQKADQDLAELELRTVRIMCDLGFNLSHCLLGHRYE